MEEEMIIQIEDWNHALRHWDWFQVLVDIYIRCFAEQPWNERWEPNVVVGEFEKNLSHRCNICLLWVESKQPVAATINYPIRFKNDVREFVPEIEWPYTLYLAEMFVDSRYRRRGIARTLHQKRLELARELEFTQAVQRTSRNSKMFPLIEQTGFKQLATQQTWSEKEDGCRPDERVISIRSL